MGTYYVDQRNPINGNGATADIANGATGPMNVLSKVCDPTYVPNGDHTIEVIEGSGPYYYDAYDGLPAHARNSESFIQPGQTSGSFVWNFNGNDLHGDKNVNDPIYGFKWVLSPTTGLYYLTNSVGGSPELRLSAYFPTKISSVVIDGYWMDESMSLVGVVPAWWYNNYKYGDFDALGFSTLYIRWDGGDPTGKDVEIWVAQIDQIFSVSGTANVVTTTVNDAVLCGSQVQIIRLRYGFNVNRSRLFNAASQGIEITDTMTNGGLSVKNCIFDRCGHRGVNIAQTGNVDIYNCHFEHVHLGARLAANTSYIVNMYNNSSRNLYAGFIQKDVAIPTLNENYNQIHLDLLSVHGPTIAFTTATRQWTTTGAHDLPANTATSLTTSIDPLMVSSEDFRLTTTSPCIATGTDVGLREDAYGNHIYGLPNIGATERVPVAPVISDDFFIGSDGTTAMEGQIRDPKVTS